MQLPIGAIILWADGDIPSGWQLCDGTNETPDMRSRFARGATDSDDLLDSGGATTHTHTNPNTGTKSAHTHTASNSTGGMNDLLNHTKNSPPGGSSHPAAEVHSHGVSLTTGSGDSHSHTVGITNAANNMPPHIKLYYIMRIE